MGGALRTDLYELNMAVSYLRRGMTQPATFSLFVRSLPPGWGFLVACGLEACLDHLEDISFTDEELAWLGETQGYGDRDLERLGALRFTGDAVAIPEGSLVYPDEPLLEITAPLPEAQLVETILLNQITYQTAIASKAARCVLADPGARIVDFAFRRVHGVEAGTAVARATAIAGFAATSNVEAARALGLPATGTMAHSYIEAFPSEEDAFRAFAEDLPERVVLLVDTYDTLRGVQKAIEVARSGAAVTAIRLDSGDLGELARAARGMLDEAGLGEVQIYASGGLDEHRIAALADTPIDAYGVGSRVGVAADAPYLDSVYKLVDEGGRPVAKLSTAKATLPGRKQVWRGPGGDMLGLRDEEGPADAEPLLQPAMTSGARLNREGWREARERCAAALEALPAEARALDAAPPPVARSEALERLTRDVRETIRDREVSG